VNATTGGPGGDSGNLLPHQSTLIETVLSPTGRPLVLLRAPVGLGKTAALVALTRRLMREKPTARTLVLCPAAVSTEWVARFRDGGTPALLIDRYKFRELLDARSRNEVWPRGYPVVLRDDFAKQADIKESLAAAEWALVIADEAHRFTGSRADLLRRVGAVAERVVFVTGIPSGAAEAFAFPLEDATVVEWRRDQLADASGKPLEAARRLVPNEITFALTPSERLLSETVHQLSRALDLGTPQTEVFAASLLRSLRSSPAAVESTLQRLTARLEQQDGIALLPEEAIDDGDQPPTAELPDPIAAETTKAIVERALEELDALSTDSKLAAFNSLLKNMASVEIQGGRIAVTTDFLSTAFYLTAEVEGHGLNSLLLHGEMAHEDRQKSVARFVSSGKILIATTAVAAAGVSLPDVTDLVLYDFPSSNLVLAQIISQFDRVGRENKLNIHVLVQSDSAERTALDLPRRLREMTL
jgi:ERCC4-related helicase